MRTLFDIFSKKAPKANPKKEKLKIVVDYREKNSMVVSEVVSLGIEIDFRKLEIGDYIVRGVVIERKTVSDFINSMKSGRLITQLDGLKQYDSRLLVIEGIDEQELYTDSEQKIGMHPNSVRGFLLSILLKHKVPIIFTQNYEDTAKFLLVLSKQEDRESPLNPTRKFHTVKEQRQYVLEGFPGIGPKTAKKLLDKFGSIKEVINAPEEELRKLIGVKVDGFCRTIS